MTYGFNNPSNPSCHVPDAARMIDTTATNESDHLPSAAPRIGDRVQETHANVGNLLAKLCDTAPLAAENSEPAADSKYENELAMVRLGMATSLFFSLRTKHAPTAAHSLRVALVCSAWAERLKLDEHTRDRIEIAALLHDLGKIGIPDRILRKPGKLTVDEQLTMDCCPALGCEILRGCTSDRELLDIIHYANTWFDGRRGDESPKGDALPLGSRMLSIADAFDSMTTDHVYRSALSRERALGELVRGGGVQFDPELVTDFCRMLEDRPEMLQGVVVSRWLVQLQPNASAGLWQSSIGSHATLVTETVRRESLFFGQLMHHLKDCVAFTDSEGTITHWNRAMQQLTGIAAEAIVGKTWNSTAMRLREPMSHPDDIVCPVTECLRNAVTISRSMLIEQAGAEATRVQVEVAPVVGEIPGTHGTVIIMQDVSDQADLQEQVESLHEKTTIDPLTGVANRAYFDEKLQELLKSTREGGPSFSLVICDIDHFKRVNDVHGHPAGDEALVTFASVLTAHSRSGDLVARYGGEEFLLLAIQLRQRNRNQSRRSDSARCPTNTTSQHRW